MSACICTPAIAGISDGPNVDCPEHGSAEGYQVATLTSLSRRLGLSTTTIKELLNAGWRYVDEAGRVPVWQAPLWALAAEVSSRHDSDAGSEGTEGEARTSGVVMKVKYISLDRELGPYGGRVEIVSDKQDERNE